MKRAFLFYMAVVMYGMVLAGCSQVLPPVQPYPYQDPASLKAQAQSISDTLEAYIRDWAAGRVPSLIPESVLPPGIYVDENDPNKNYNTQTESLYKNISIVNPSGLDPAAYTYVRTSHIIDQNYLYAQFPDNHYSYLHTFYLAPFGSKTIVKGKFPHARFFLLTPSAPMNGLQYFWGPFGTPENPIIDVDIIPDPGNINPFMVGANRTATNRNYTVVFENKIGDVGFLPEQYAPKPPFYRGAGNVRYASGILPKGPGPGGPPDGKNMLWGGGAIWGRYGLPDNHGKPGFDVLAGVGLPTIEQQLSTGEKFLIITDMTAKKAFFSYRFQALVVNNEPSSATATEGWLKMWGIGNAVIHGYLQTYGMTSASDKTYNRDLIKGLEGRGYDLPAPGNWEGSATCVNYCNYFTHNMKLAQGKVTVLTGTLPTFPKTKGGEAIMTAAQTRYFSIVANEEAINPVGNRSQPGVLVNGVCDDEILLDSNRRYVICLSRVADKPANATSANGVTWVNWGTNSDAHWTIRWVSISPDWYFSKTPDEARVTWYKTDWASPGYDPNVLGGNARTGWAGAYLPKVSYMQKKCFEDLGSPVTWAKVDTVAWDSGCCGTPIAGGNSGTAIILLPLLLSMAIGVSVFVKRRRG